MVHGSITAKLSYAEKENEDLKKQLAALKSQQGSRPTGQTSHSRSTATVTPLPWAPQLPRPSSSYMEMDQPDQGGYNDPISPTRDPMGQDYGENVPISSTTPIAAEQEILDAMSRESRRMIRDCMDWEKRVLHSASQTMLTPENIQEHYKVPTLPYPLLKQEVQLLKQTLLWYVLEMN